LPHTATTSFNSWDALKLAGLLLMFVDHSGHFFFTHEQWLRGIGRGAPPVFLFLAGYASSYRFKWSVLFLAMAMTLSDIILTGHIRTQNILVSILIWHALFYWMQKKNKKIERPYEWFIICFVWIPTLFLFQYGTYGLMFASCGYMKKRNYDKKTQRNFWLLSFVTYGAITAIMSEFSPLTTACMVITLSTVGLALWRFEIRDIILRPHWLERLAKRSSYYSGYIYALHLIALEWITGIPF
jgi:hypothetical protein